MKSLKGEKQMDSMHECIGRNPNSTLVLINIHFDEQWIKT